MSAIVPGDLVRCKRDFSLWTYRGLLDGDEYDNIGDVIMNEDCGLIVAICFYTFKPEGKSHHETLVLLNDGRVGWCSAGAWELVVGSDNGI